MKKNETAIFKFNEKRRGWTIKRGPAILRGWRNLPEIEVNNETFRPEDAREQSHRELKNGGEWLELAYARFSWTIRLEPTTDGTFQLRGKIRNTAASPLRLGLCRLFHGRPGSRKKKKKTTTGNLLFRWDQCWAATVEKLDGDYRGYSSRHLSMICNPAEEQAFFAGFTTLDQCLTRVDVFCDSAARLETFSAFCDFQQFELKPGAVMETECLQLAVHADPHQLLQNWVKQVRRVYRPKFNSETPTGWLGWAWVDKLSEREESAEKIILENCRAIRERLAGFPVDYIWMSQVNLKDMAPGNWLKFNRKHFPHGFRNTLKKMMDDHFKPGLWVAPFWIFTAATAVFNQNRKNLIRKKSDRLYKQPIDWEFIAADKDSDGKTAIGFLDPTHPDSHSFMEKVFSTYYEMGIRYYMLDFLGDMVRMNATDQPPHDPSITWTAAMRRLIETIRRAAGKDTHLLTAVASTPIFTGCIDASRINTDYGEGRPLYPPFRCHYSATYAINDPHFGNTRLLLQRVAANYFTHRQLYINDYNMLTIDKPLPRGIAEINTTILGLSGSPIMLGDDIRKIHPQRLQMIKQCLPRTTEVAFPLDLFERPGPELYPRLFSLAVDTPWERYILLAAYNLDDRAWTGEVDFFRLGLPKNRLFRVYEFWNEQYVGTRRDTLEISVPPLACRLYRIAPARKHPWLLSSDLHIQQGKVEIRDLTWNAESLILSGTALRPQGETGNLIFLMPPGYRLINHENHFLLKDGRDSTVQIRRPLTFPSDAESFTLEFAPIENHSWY